MRIENTNMSNHCVKQGAKLSWDQEQCWSKTFHLQKNTNTLYPLREKNNCWAGDWVTVKFCPATLFALLQLLRLGQAWIRMKMIFYFTHFDVGTPEPFSTENHSSCHQASIFCDPPIMMIYCYWIFSALYYKLLYFPS